MLGETLCRLECETAKRLDVGSSANEKGRRVSSPERDALAVWAARDAT